MAKVLVAEKIAEPGLEQLREAGHLVDVRLGLEPAELLEAVADCDALIVRSQTQVTEEVLAAAEHLKIIARAGIGVDNVDTEAATARGVVVVNAPRANAISAAEHTLGLILSQARHIPQAHADLVGGGWNRSQFQGVELSEKTLGIVGFGQIGQLIAERAAAFHMRIVAYDPYISFDRFRQLGAEPKTLEEIFAEADFITLHVAKTPETTGMVNAELLAKAKPTLRIVNVSRGGIINEADLAEAIKAGVVAGAALDVFDEEPPAGSPLLGLPGVVVTPHLGASTKEAQEKAGVSVATQVGNMLAGKLPRFAVNIHAAQTPEELLPYLPLCETLGGIFGSLVRNLPDTVEIEFSGLIGEVDTKMGMLAMLTGLLSPVCDDPVSYVNAEEIARSRGLEVRAINTSAPKDYVSEVTLRGGGHGVGGALLGVRAEPRIIWLEGHRVDQPPSDHMVVIRNDDKPGVIGAIGHVMGEMGINISDMDVGAVAEDNEALILLATDKPADSETVEKLRNLAAVRQVRAINLPPKTEPAG